MARRLIAPLVMILLLSGCGLFGSSPKPDNAARTFLDAWAAGYVARAAAATDDSAAATPVLTRSKAGLAASKVEYTLGAVGDSTVAYTMKVSFPGVTQPWTYDGSLAMAKAGDDWTVHWQPADLHPKLAAGQTLDAVRALPDRAALQDRNGVPLFAKTDVVTVGVQPDQVKDLNALAAALAANLPDVTAAEVVADVKAAKPTSFVPVVTVRDADYRKARPVIYPIPGTVFRASTRVLGPTATFGQPFLGRVGEATADLLKEYPGQYVAGDQLGSSGLQKALNSTLTGTPTVTVRSLDAKGKAAAMLGTITGKAGTPVTLTIDRTVQSAAEGALATLTGKKGAVVAIKPSTGEILAVANSADASIDMAMAGQYPAGSTYKIITASALLSTGTAKATQMAPCPGTIDIGGRTFHNEDSFNLGSISLEQAFAHSCNTTFASFAQKLPAGAFEKTAAQFGIGAGWDLPVTAFSGSLAPPADPVELAADAIGQGKVLVSPFSMAVVAATLQKGAVPTPTLIAGTPAAPKTAPPAGLSSAVLGQVRGFARQVVLTGTAKALAGQPGEPAGKTGTAEYGTATPPRSHAWFVGYRGDLAFAVFVEDGESSGTTAVPVAGQFLTRVG